MTLLTLTSSNAAPLSIRAKALVFEDPRSKALLHQIQQVASSNASVLITGETGTGKEIVAHHLHDLSARRDKPFVGVNCGAFSENLAESELFGHERGAFTGAIASKPGWFESAHGGTLFLDEIGDLALAIQVKLLRVLQEREVVRLGSRSAVPIDVRLVAATNVKLDEAVAAGHFREDLFYRLNVATLAVPALRERKGDILPLAGYFLELYRQRLGRPAAVLLPDATERLLDHAWPGNIRELENVIHHALLICHGNQVAAADLRLSTLRTKSKPPVPPIAKGAALETALAELFEQNLPNLFEYIEEVLFRTAYSHCDENQVQTAKLLGVSRNVVRARLMQYREIPGARAKRPEDRPASAHTPPPASARLLRVLP
jgi:sigma-54-specific transcriptional regulator